MKSLLINKISRDFICLDSSIRPPQMVRFVWAKFIIAVLGEGVVLYNQKIGKSKFLLYICTRKTSRAVLSAPTEQVIATVVK